MTGQQKNKLTPRSFIQLFESTYRSWIEREPFNSSVIIAYYSIFSLPGLLVIIINMAGYFYGIEAVTHSISQQIGGLVGASAAKDIESIVASASQAKGNVLATALSIATLLFGATGVFYQLQQILNKMWEVKPKPKQKILKLIRDRLFSFGLILVVAFLLLISLVISALLSALTSWFSRSLSDSLEIVFYAIDIIISIGVITLLFAAIFKFLPDARIRWKDVWFGAFVTAFLFIIAKFALGLYFGQSNPGTPYGAAGTIVLIMLWVSYSGMILLFGAELTQVYANRFGKKVEPVEGAVSTSEKKERSRARASDSPARA
jgi:membrane protein